MFLVICVLMKSVTVFTVCTNLCVYVTFDTVSKNNKVHKFSHYLLTNMYYFLPYMEHKRWKFEEYPSCSFYIDNWKCDSFCQAPKWQMRDAFERVAPSWSSFEFNGSCCSSRGKSPTLIETEWLMSLCGSAFTLSLSIAELKQDLGCCMPCETQPTVHIFQPCSWVWAYVYPVCVCVCVCRQLAGMCVHRQY